MGTDFLGNVADSLRSLLLFLFLDKILVDQIALCFFVLGFGLNVVLFLELLLLKIILLVVFAVYFPEGPVFKERDLLLQSAQNILYLIDIHVLELARAEDSQLVLDV